LIAGSLADLPEGARSLLEAARELLAEGGFTALSLENISRRAGKNKAMVRHYFGGKAPLVAVLVDSLIHDAVVGMVEQTEALPEGEERVKRYLGEIRGLLDDPEFPAFFDVLPHALRDDDLRARLAMLYQWYRELNERCLTSSREQEDGKTTKALAMLVIAATDGLAIQMALDPGIDPDPSLSLLERLARVVLEADS
jgi:AcrR family transcriptional regulator